MRYTGIVYADIHVHLANSKRVFLHTKRQQKVLVLLTVIAEKIVPILHDTQHSFVSEP